jgi:hypothetical protein
VTTTLSYVQPLESVIVCDQPEEQVPLLKAQGTQAAQLPQEVLLPHLDYKVSGTLCLRTSPIIILAEGTLLRHRPSAARTCS